jgi:hypothetical protein
MYQVQFESGLQLCIHLIWIRIQHFGLNTGTDPDPNRILIQVLMTKNEKNLKLIKYFFVQKIQFHYL